MRAAAVVLSSINVIACAHGVTTTKVGDDTFRIQCSELGLDRCLGEAASNACDRRGYFVARGISDVNLRGRSDAPDVVLSSEAVIRCAPTSSGWGDQGKELMSGAGSLAVASKPAAAATASAPASVSTPPKAPVCAPGSTQACIGTAACQGGQACKADGSGYEPCDCGPAATLPSSASPPNPGAVTP